jgi:hypothetical protein
MRIDNVNIGHLSHKYMYWKSPLKRDQTLNDAIYGQDISNQ